MALDTGCGASSSEPLGHLIPRTHRKYKGGREHVTRTGGVDDSGVERRYLPHALDAVHASDARPDLRTSRA